MNDGNKSYYKHVYDKVHASDDLKERMIHMGEKGEKREKKVQRKIWKSAVAAVILLAVAVPSGVYAAQHWGMAGYFADNGALLTKDAEKLIQKDVSQTKEEKQNKELPVDFSVKETLCDNYYIYVVLEAKVMEKGKYLLVPESFSIADSVLNLGIKEEKTIGNYAKEKGLELLHIGYTVEDTKEFSTRSYMSDFSFLDENTMEMYFSVPKEENDSKDLNVAVRCTARAAKEGSKSSLLNFKVQDNSSSETVLYAAKDMAVKGTKAVITKITMETTEVGTYVNVYYDDSDITLHDNSLFFKIRDENGEQWMDMLDASCGRLDHRGIGNGKHCCRMAYSHKKFPKKFILEAFNCMETGVVYDQLLVEKVK